jgi:hypothetical protein
MEIVLHITQYSSSLCRYDSITFIKSFDGVHQTHIQNNFIKDWLTTTNQSGVSTLWNNGQSCIITIFENSCHFFIALWLEHQLALPLELLGPVLIVGREVILVCDDLVFLKD